MVVMALVIREGNEGGRMEEETGGNKERRKMWEVREK